FGRSDHTAGGTDEGRAQIKKRAGKPDQYWTPIPDQSWMHVDTPSLCSMHVAASCCGIDSYFPTIYMIAE
ncbi:MAG: hypothetical protein WAU56_10380, partial [Steroidobacteraceae bacterium]